MKIILNLSELQVTIFTAYLTEQYPGTHICPGTIHKEITEIIETKVALMNDQFMYSTDNIMDATTNQILLNQ